MQRGPTDGRDEWLRPTKTAGVATDRAVASDGLATLWYIVAHGFKQESATKPDGIGRNMNRTRIFAAAAVLAALTACATSERSPGKRELMIIGNDNKVTWVEGKL